MSLLEDSVVSQGGLAGAGHAGDGDQLPLGNIQVKMFQIVFPGVNDLYVLHIVYTIFNSGKIIAQNDPPHQKPDSSNNIARNP